MALPAQFLDASNRPLLLSADPQAWIEARGVGDIVRAGNRNTQLSDSEKDATLIGGQGDDTYYVSAWGARLQEAPGSGVDTVIAWRNIELPANFENLVLNYGSLARGNDQANIIIVDTPGALVVGGRGDDVLVGGKGATTFEFAAGSGRDVIQRFSTADYAAEDGGRDVVRLQDYGFTSFDQVKAAMVQQGADTVLRLSDADSVTFRDKAVGEFSAANFQLQFDPKGLTLTFQDEFDTLNLYSSASHAGTWKTSFIFGDQTGPMAKDSRTLSASDNSIMIYVDKDFAGLAGKPLGLDPFSIKDGVLDITATRTPDAVQAQLWNYEFTSGLITTEKSFEQTYGYFEMRAKLPLAEGAWPAFWLLPTDASWPPEADIMEQIGGDTVYFSKHSIATGVQQSQTWKMDLADPTQFHTYGLLWTASTLTWYVDGVAAAATSTPADMNKPMYMLANLAMGGNWPGDPDPSLQSATFEIDYIRAYSLDPSMIGTPNPIPPPSPGHGAAHGAAETTALTAADVSFFDASGAFF